MEPGQDAPKAWCPAPLAGPGTGKPFRPDSPEASVKGPAEGGEDGGDIGDEDELYEYRDMMQKRLAGKHRFPFGRCVASIRRSWLLVNRFVYILGYNYP